MIAHHFASRKLHDNSHDPSVYEDAMHDVQCKKILSVRETRLQMRVTAYCLFALIVRTYSFAKSTVGKRMVFTKEGGQRTRINKPL